MSSELAPFAKTGGLADVAGALSRHLDESGHDVRVLMPRYARMVKSGVESRPVDGLTDLSMRLGSRDVSWSVHEATLPGTRTRIYLLDCPEFYGRDAIYTEDADEHLRFVMLSKAAIELCQRLGFAPDIFHSHDWQTALMPLYLRTVYHQDDLKAGVINCLKTGILYADLVTTVSPTYAREILGDEYGMGLNHLLRAIPGRVNGKTFRGEHHAAYIHLTPTQRSQFCALFRAKTTSCRIRCLARHHVRGGQ